MATLKVNIIADGKQALSNIKELTGSVEDTSKSFAKLRSESNQLEVLNKKIANLSEGSDEYNRILARMNLLGNNLSKTQNQYMMQLNRQVNAYYMNADAASATAKAVSLLKKEEVALTAQVRDTDFIQKISDWRKEAEAALKQIQADNAKINAQLQAQAELQKDIAKARQQYTEYISQGEADFSSSWATAKQQNVDYLKATALGDNTAIMKQQYSLLDAELTKILTTEGKLSPKTKEIADRMLSLEKSMKKASKTPINERMKNLVKSFVSAQVVVYALQTGFRNLINVIKDAAEAASKAEETANLFNTTFETISSTANKVSTQLSSSLGMSNSTIQQSLGLFGDLAMGYGQTQDAALKFAESAVQTGLDIMSFKNISGDTTEVLQTMASGLAGNFENFRKWGIIVTQAEIKTRLQQKGLDKLTGSSLQFAKVQETLAIVQEKSKNATGDMARTLESTENITRRFSEANKELLENMGQSVNAVLNPIKKIWIDIATQINKAAKAEKEFSKGGYQTGVYNVTGNESDKKAFNQAIGLKAYGTYSIGTFTGIMNIENYAKTVSDAMILFDATLEDTINAVKDAVSISEENLNSLIEVLIEKDRERSQWTSEQRALENRRLSIENNASSISSFVDSLSGINGVSFGHNYSAEAMNWVAPAFYDTDMAFNDATNELSKVLDNAISEAISSLSAADWTEFSDTIGVALGDVTESAGLEEKLKSIYSLYESVYNLRLEDGKLTEDEKAELQKIADLYKDISDRVSTISSFNSMKESFTSGNQSLLNEFSDLRKTDLEKSIAEVQRQFASIDFSKLSGEEQELLNTLYDERITLLKKIDTEKQLIKAEEEYANRVSSVNNKITDLRKEIYQFGLSDRDVAVSEVYDEWSTALEGITDNEKVNEINKKFSEMLSLTKGFYDLQERSAKEKDRKTAGDSFNETMSALRERNVNPFLNSWAKAQAGADAAVKEWKSGINTSVLGSTASLDASIRDEYMKKYMADMYSEMGNSVTSALGETWHLYDAIGMLAGGGGFGGLIGILVDLATQTELFSKASSFISDTVLPVLNAFLEPAVDLLDALSGAIQGLLVDALDPFFAVFKTSMSLITDLLNPIVEILSSLINEALSPVELILDTVAEILIPIVSTLSSLISMLSPLFEILTVIMAILNPIIETILKPIANFLKWLFEMIITGFTYAEVFLKKVMGSILGFFLDTWNGIVGILRSINILGWRPFEGMEYADTTKSDNWKNLKYEEEVKKKLDELNEKIGSVAETNLEIAQNTNPNDERLKEVEDLYQRGIITALQRDAEVASLAGRQYDPTKLYSGGIYRSTGYQTSVSYGDMTFVINTDNMTGSQVKDLAKEVIRQLDERTRPGSKTVA